MKKIGSILFFLFFVLSAFYVADSEAEITPSPADNSPFVSLNVIISATFSDDMDEGTINKDTFIVKMLGAYTSETINGSVTYNDKVAIFTPSENLSYFTQYHVTLTTGIQDWTGNPLSEDYTWIFNTTNDPNNSLPWIVSTNPPNGSDSVSVNKNISVIFPEDRDKLGLDEDTFTVNMREGYEFTPVIGTVTHSDNTATFELASDLEYEKEYEVRLCTSSPCEGWSVYYYWSFSTEPSDTKPPTIVSTKPDYEEYNVAVDTSVSVTFSEEMDETSIKDYPLKLNDGLKDIDVEVSYTNKTATYTPKEFLNEGTTYTASISTSVTDLAGNALENEKQWEFKTKKIGDVNEDTEINLTDAILALHVLIGLNPPEAVTSNGSDVNRDAKIGIAEVIYILKAIAGSES